MNLIAFVLDLATGRIVMAKASTASSATTKPLWRQLGAGVGMRGNSAWVHSLLECLVHRGRIDGLAAIFTAFGKAPYVVFEVVQDTYLQFVRFWRSAK